MYPTPRRTDYEERRAQPELSLAPSLPGTAEFGALTRDARRGHSACSCTTGVCSTHRVFGSPPTDVAIQDVGSGSGVTV